MKTRLLILSFLCLFAATISAQEIRLNGYASYVFDDRVNSYYDYDDFYDGTVEGGLMWGVGLEYMANPFMGVELMYLRMDTEAPLEYYDFGYKFNRFNLGINYIQIGGNRYFPTGSDIVEPYLGASAGMSIINLENPLNGNKDSRGFFAWGIKGGTNLNFSETVGLKLQAQLMSSVQSFGGGFYFGTGGAGAGVSTYSTFFQFGFTGGLVFRFNSSY